MSQRSFEITGIVHAAFRSFHNGARELSAPQTKKRPTLRRPIHLTLLHGGSIPPISTNKIKKNLSRLFFISTNQAYLGEVKDSFFYELVFPQPLVP